MLQSIPHVSSRASAEEVHALLEDYGVAVIDGLADRATIDRVVEELSPWLSLPPEKSPVGATKFGGYRTLRTSGLMGKSAACGELAVNPLVLAIADRVLGPQCARFQIGVTQAISIAPGEKPQVIHRDTALYPFKRPGPEVFVNTIWAATDFTVENGATRFFPGSHRWPEERVPGAGDVAIGAEMQRGSVVVYYGSTFHGGGANTTEAPRVGIALGYILGWLRQEENQYLAVPPEKARTLPVELQRLIGYAVHDPLLGFYEGGDHEVLYGGRCRARYRTELQGGRGWTVAAVLEEGAAARESGTRRG